MSLLVKPLALSAVCVILFAISFPPIGVSAAAFFCMVPLFWVAVSVKRSVNALIAGLLIGFAVENIKFYWIYNVSGFGFKEGLVVGFYLAAYYGVWAFLAKYFYARMGANRLYIFGMAAAWVCLEWLLSNLSFLSFGWATLAHTQTSNIVVLQLAAVFGAYGISFFVALCNILIATFFHNTNDNLFFLTIIALFTLVFGGYQLFAANEAPDSLRVSSIQPSFTRALALSEQDPERRLDRLETLSDRSLEYNPELLVWPEASVRGKSVDLRDENVNRVFNYSRLNNVAIIFGYSSVEKGGRAETSVAESEALPKRLNNVLSISPNTQEIKRYAKRKLMPFGEYQPITIKNELFDAFLPEIVDVEKGIENVNFKVGGVATISPIICWEVLFDDFVREAVTGQVNLIILFNNDNWFGVSPAGEQHNRSAILRAVENGRPMIVSSNTGPTIFLDEKGRLLASSSSIYDHEMVIADIPLTGKKTYYRIFGHYFIIVCLMFFLALGFRSITINRNS